MSRLYLQKARVSGGIFGTQSLTVALSNPTMAGNTIVAVVGTFGNTAATNSYSASDSQSNGYTKEIETTHRGAANNIDAFVRVFVATCVRGNLTFKITGTDVNNNTELDIQLFEYPANTGIDGTPNSVSQETCSAGASLATGPISTGNANDILISFVYDAEQGATTWTQDSGWAVADYFDDSSGNSVTIQVSEQAVSSTSTYQNHFVTSTADTGFGGSHQGIIAIKAVPASPTGDQVANGASTNMTSDLTIDFELPNLANGTILVGIGLSYNIPGSPTYGVEAYAAALSVSDSMSNTYVLANTTPARGVETRPVNWNQMLTFVAKTIAAGANSVTVHINGTGIDLTRIQVTSIIREVPNNVSTFTAVGASQTTLVSGGTGDLTTASVTGTSSSNRYCSFCYDPSNNTSVLTVAGFSIVDDFQDSFTGTDTQMAEAEKTPAAPATVSAHWTSDFGGGGSGVFHVSLVALGPSALGSTPIIQVQSGGGGISSPGGSHSITMPQIMVAGNRVVIMTCLTNTVRSVGSITDDAAGGSSVYTFKTAVNQSTNVRIELWVCEKVKAAKNITITLSSGTSIQCSSVSEFGNTLGFGNFTTNTAASTQTPSVSLTAQRASSMMVGGFTTADAPTVTQGIANLLTSFLQGSVASSSQSELPSPSPGASVSMDVAIGTSDNVAMAAIEIFANFPLGSGPGTGGAQVSGGRMRGPRSEFIG